MLNRLFYRLKYAFSSGFLGGLLLLIFPEWRTLGIYLIIIGGVLFAICAWLEKKTEPKNTYEADEDGNAKPKYR